MSTPESVPSPTSVLFARGVIARLAIWATLRIAIQENWGGPHGPAKRRWLASALVDAFEDEAAAPPDDVYVEEMLLQVMLDEFEMVVEDGSAEGVAQDVVRLWEETRTGKAELVIVFEELAGRAAGRRVSVREEVVVGDEEDGEWEDDEGTDEEEEVPQLLNRGESSSTAAAAAPREALVDQDGFTLVQSKKRR